MRKKFFLIAALISLSSCAGMPNGIGVNTITGSLLGGVIGTQFGGGDGTVGGIAGTFIGAAVGNYLEEDYVSPPPLSYQQKQFLNKNYGMSFPMQEYRLLTNREIHKIERAFPKTRKGEPACRVFNSSKGYGPSVGIVCLDKYGRWRMIE